VCASDATDGPQFLVSRGVPATWVDPGEFVAFALGLLLWLGLAGLVAAVAVSKGRHPIGWFLVALVFPVVTLIVALLVPDGPRQWVDRPDADADEAAEVSPVARALALSPRPCTQLVAATGLSQRAVTEHLHALRHLDRAASDDQGVWCGTRPPAPS
jgi:hypothetical protein